MAPPRLPEIINRARLYNPHLLVGTSVWELPRTVAVTLTGSLPQRMRTGDRTLGDFLGLAVVLLVASNPASPCCAGHLVGRCCKLCPGTERTGSSEGGRIRSDLRDQSIPAGKGGSKESRGCADSSSHIIRMQSDASAAPCPAQDAQPGIKSSCYGLLAPNRAIKHEEREHCPG